MYCLSLCSQLPAVVASGSLLQACQCCFVHPRACFPTHPHQLWRGGPVQTGWANLACLWPWSLWQWSERAWPAAHRCLHWSASTQRMQCAGICVSIQGQHLFMFPLILYAYSCVCIGHTAKVRIWICARVHASLAHNRHLPHKKVCLLRKIF